MTEDKLLNKTLELIDEMGTAKAYQYLLDHMRLVGDMSSQIYNYLYCLAATSDRPDESIAWLEEAINDKGLWYRPEVFKDEDLDSIREDDRFIICEKISSKRYEAALKGVKTEFTWKQKIKENLMIVLHGNLQNNSISQRIWSDVELPGVQIEFLQSKEIDSYDLYRWNDDGDGPDQLSAALGVTMDSEYKDVTLVGFSAGCNTILRAITEGEIFCSAIILFAPWIPIVEEKCEEVIGKLRKRGIKVSLICGTLDEDCMPQCELLEKAVRDMDYECEISFIDGLGHEYPDQLVGMIFERNI